METNEKIEEQIYSGEVKNSNPDLFEIFGWDPSSIVPLTDSDANKVIKKINSKVLYHGSPATDLDRLDVGEDSALYLAHNEREANEYTGHDGRIYKVRVNLKNPLFVIDSDVTMDLSGDEYFGEMRRRGYDSIVALDNGELVILDESALNNSNETDKTAGDKIKRQLSRWFMPGGNLPESVQQAKRGRDRDVAVHEFDVSMLVGKLDSAMKAAKINPDKLTDDQWAKYHQYLTGENNGATLNQSERDVLLAMRGHIDGLTRDYVASVNNKLQQRLESEGIEDPNEIARLEKMLGNIGKYLNRSYKAFDDEKWFSKIPTNVIDDARAYLIRQHIDNGISQDEAVRRAQVTLNEIVKTGTAYDSLGAFISESKLGAKDLSSLIKRKNIAPEIRALLGEYADPRINYAKSVSKMSAMIANDKLLNTIRDMGMNSFIFEKDSRPANATVQLAGEASEVYAPLNGMWTTPEIKEAFEDAMGGDSNGGWLDKVIQINGFIKFGKTVLSPTTAMRNIMSSYFFTVANGHFNQKYMKQAISAFNAQVKGKVTDGESDYMKRLIKLGVIYDSANAGEMVKMMTDGKVTQMLEGKSGAAFENLRWLTSKATGFYRFGDDFWKIIGFENEKAALLRAGMAEGEAEVLAAERIQDTYPTYSRVGKAGVWLSRFPLAGTFVSFPAEIIRTTGNMMKLAASEIKSSDPAIRAMGARRIVGISLASGGMFALGALTKAMFGVTDDEEDALRDLSPPWQKNSTFLYAGRDKDGNLRYFDMTFMDPYAYWKRPIEAIMRDQPINEAISSSLSDMVSPFLGTDISAGKVLEVINNKKESGGQIYKENDTAIRKGADIASHLALGLAPGAVNNAWRIGMAAADVKRSTGKPYSLSDEMLALAGFRSSTFDPKVSLYYRTFDFNSSVAEARKELSGVLRDPNKVSDSEISNAKARAKTKQEQAFNQMARLIKAAETGGASRSQVVQILLLSGVSKQNVNALLRGVVPPVNLSDKSYESAVKRAELIMDSETAREVRSRFNRITRREQP
ncbi:ADP-ribosyltransferase [Pseudoalteromonas phage vB_Pun_Y3]